MKDWDSNISKFCLKIQSYRRIFGRLLGEFLNKRYIAESDNKQVTIEATSKLKIEKVSISSKSNTSVQELEQSTTSCIENLIGEYMKSLNDIKSQFGVVKQQLNKEYDIKLLNSSDS